MDSEDEDNYEISHKIIKFIKKGYFQGALNYFRKNAADFKKCSWNLLPKIAKNFKPNVAPNIIALCTELLIEIAKHGEPADLPFEFLNTIAESNNRNLLLLSSVDAIDIILHRVSEQKVLSTLCWFYILVCDVLKNTNLKDDTALFQKVDDLTCKLIDYLNENTAVFFDDDHKRNGRQMIGDFLMMELGLLAVYEPEHPLLRKVMTNIGRTFLNLDLPLVQFLDKNYENEHVPDLGFQMMYYLVWHQSMELEKFPTVFSEEFLFHSAVFLACGMMEKEEKMHMRGLCIMKAILISVNPNSISHYVLSQPCHVNFFKILSKIMVYDTNEKIRKEAVIIFRQYVESFNPKGRHLFIMNSLLNCEQQGVIAYIITLAKDFIEEYLTDGCESNYFSENLINLVPVLCILPKVKDTNIFDANDQVITILSLIRYLSLKDPKPGKLGTGIWQLESKIKSNFINPLGQMIEKSRNCLKQHLDYAVKNKDKKLTQPMNVVVQGEGLPTPDYEEQVAGVESKLITLDLIQMRLDIALENWGT